VPGSFIDTNILVHLAPGDAGKAATAEQILAAGGIISVQVVNEIATVARRRMRLSWAETNTFLDMRRRLMTVHPLTIESFETGLARAEQYGFSVHDATIAPAAAETGCDTLLSEDMPDGLVVKTTLRILTPFRMAA